MRNRFPARRIFLVASILAAISVAVTGQEFVPFAIPARIDANQAIWMTGHQPVTTGSQRLVVKEGHFYRGGRRVRIWGVNLSFGANFPTHEEAVHVATRMAAAGVNSVRCHHMDTSRWPAGVWNSRDGKTIEPEALDRLDFFINELAKRGIFVNINLHVGREHSEYLGLSPANREYDKISGIFTPALVNAQKQYARDLLTHINPYRGVRYADDPAVAFVEITNEDSFFMWDGEETLRTLPRYYAGILRGQHNAWLRQRYGSDEALRAAWGKGTQPLGANVLQNGDFASWDAGKATPRDWSLEQHEGCIATISRPRGLPRDAIQIQIGKANDTQWHLQFTQGGFRTTQGQYYTLSFEASSLKTRSIGCSVGQAHDPWGNLGLSRAADLGPEWKTFSFGFVATADDANARVSFAFSGDSTQFHLAHVELRAGGQIGLAEGESLNTGNVDLFRDKESAPRILDRVMFLAQTEKAYFDGMRSYLRNDLGCGALVTGTIVFGPLGLYAQSDMDFVDTHAYWQHPRFPGTPWDAGNWTIEQWPMTDRPSEATLFRLAAQRFGGKPFTVSEYNHPAPLDAQAECVPMLASFAAAQDWDGLWFYTYSHSSDNWAREFMYSYFDIDTNPTKWGFMRAGAAIFLRDDPTAVLSYMRSVEIARLPDELAVLAGLHVKHGTDMFGVLRSAANIAYEDMLRIRYVPTYGTVIRGGPLPQIDVTTLDWSVNGAGQDIYRAAGPRTEVCIGHAARFEQATNGRIRIASPDFATVAITALDEGSKILITACGRCENSGMQFSQDRRTVGRNWGQAPVRIEPVRGSVTLTYGGSVWHALAPDGSPRQQLPVTYENGQPRLTLAPEYGTMWYLADSGGPSRPPGAQEDRRKPAQSEVKGSAQAPMNDSTSHAVD